MAEFGDGKEFRAWLDSLPEEQRVPFGRVLALRSALRVAPLSAHNFGHKKLLWSDEKVAAEIVLPQLRALSSAAALSFAPSQAKELKSVAVDAADAAFAAANAADAVYATHVDANSAYSGYAAAHAANAAYTAVNATNAADAAVNVAAAAAIQAADAADALWRATSVDATLLKQGTPPTVLALHPLWHYSPPKWFTYAIKRFYQPLLALDQDWDVWTNWYVSRLNVGPVDTVLEVRRAKIANEDWDKGPAHVNALIKLLERERAAELAQEKLAQEAKPLSENWNFFVSYTSKDEAVAREVVSVLEKHGHNVIAQFKDFQAGNNFVAEMQRGLALGLAEQGRMIGLYSPDYFTSDHCMAEWNTAYNADPSGSKRKLVPFLIHSTELPPLARQIVYKSLTGLSPEQREAAILSAIAPPQPKMTAEEIKRAAVGVASPQARLTPDNKIDIGHNPVTDKPLSRSDLAQLPMLQRELALLLHDSVPDNTPKLVSVSLLRYADYLFQQGAQIYVPLLNQTCAGLEKEYWSTGKEFWGAGLTVNFEEFFRNHDLFKAHFPLKEEAVYSEIRVDEERAMGAAITDPIDAVQEATDALVNEQQGTETLGKVIQDNASFAKGIAHLPPDDLANQPGSTRVSIKRRYVLGTLGLLVSLYNLVGSTASILATETGRKFAAALARAIEALMKLIP